MNVLFFWEQVGGLTLQHKCNPYAGLLARALEKLDIHLELGDYSLSPQWLEEKRSTHDVLHLNWLHHFYRSTDLESTLERYAHFADRLTLAQRMGYRIVWTLHNIYPHERPFPHIDHLGRLLVCRLADAILAHCGHAAELAGRLFHRTDGVHIIPHGNFIDVYPNDMGRDQARRQLGLDPDAFVYLFFGNARAYKGIERLIEAFERSAPANAALILMMRQALDPAYGQSLAARAQGLAGVHLYTSPYFPVEDFQLYLNGADAVVLPFDQILTSGSAITALGFGRPVVLPRLGCLPELVDDSMGVLYDPKDRGGLEKAMVQISQMDTEAAGQAARARAEELDWDGIAGQIAQVYRA
ncbi:MAG: glycosyltransferase [Candidatus Latescibacteria bacterium]|nr:glycosyltransferase [Candidatus Latescibacterota bacterium]